MTSRGIRRKKSSLAEVKVAVVGAPSVGKSALTVRFLTKRYIGEYDHQQESKYKHEALLDGEAILFEILDTCPKGINDLPVSDVAQWADAIFLVYSITDRESFNFVRRAKQSLHPDVPLALVGNKADMVHLRQVSPEEGEILAKDFECSFAEVAAAEQVNQIQEVFHELSREVLAHRRRAKHSLLDRMLGSKHAYRVYSRERLKSRRSFMRHTTSTKSNPSDERLDIWQFKFPPPPDFIPPAEHLPAGHELRWPIWKSLNRLRTQVGRSRSNMAKWGYIDQSQIQCGCGAPTQDMLHLYSCPQCPTTCTKEDFMLATRNGVEVSTYWSTII